METIEHLRERVRRLKEGVWDIKRLLKALNRPLGPERTRDVLVDFTSSKNYVEVVRGLNEEDAAKLVDTLDQVCRGGL